MTTNVKLDPLDCPVCDGCLTRIDVPDLNLHRCNTCGEISQEIGPREGGGSILSPIGQLLRRNALGDDRVRAAISQPKVATAKSFIDALDSSLRVWKMEIGANVLELSQILAQAENRLDFAMKALSGMDLALPEMDGVLASIREARDLMSTLPAANRGLTKESNDDLSSFTIQTAGVND